MRAHLRRLGTHCLYCEIEVGNRNRFVQKNHPQIATRDHYIPLSRGGSNHIDNIVIACMRCNQMKGSLLPDEYMAWLGGLASRTDKGLKWRTYHGVRGMYRL